MLVLLVMRIIEYRAVGVEMRAVVVGRVLIDWQIGGAAGGQLLVYVLHMSPQ